MDLRALCLPVHGSRSHSHSRFPSSRTRAIPLVIAMTLAAAPVAAILAPGLAHADIQHTVGRGHTIEAIANRYHIPAKAIIEANHLDRADVKHLRVGEVLTIPGVKPTSDKPAEGAAKAKGVESADNKKKPADAREEPVKKGEKVAKLGKPGGRETTTFAMKPKTPGVLHAHRIATTETFDINVNDRGGRVSPTALKTFEKMMRSPAGLSHPINARLAALVGIVSNHFGSRQVEVISGFRPFTPKQFNPHSNHMHGKAIDFRIAGVPNEAVRDFCRTLRNVGCGYYPSSVFVHMDVRDQNAFWIDYSKPGERPRYNAPNTQADEGTSDVQEVAFDSPSATTTAPEEAEETGDRPSATPEQRPLDKARERAATSPTPAVIPADSLPKPVPVPVPVP